ncbi:hypothetical protein HAX54_003720 [Datura stramonium]|uniref:Uncharacterized protein n=1 Tax=Datura stramonium TaxID=4076 RepID=A0ABS8T797_DATST|nr:hypothetical protein [Datura stramonium]
MDKTPSISIFYWGDDIIKVSDIRDIVDDVTCEKCYSVPELLYFAFAELLSVVQTGSTERMESQDRLMGSRPFLSLADVAVAGHTQFRPDREPVGGCSNPKYETERIDPLASEVHPISPNILIGRCNSSLKKNRERRNWALRLQNGPPGHYEYYVNRDRALALEAIHSSLPKGPKVHDDSIFEIYKDYKEKGLLLAVLSFSLLLTIDIAKSGSIERDTRLYKVVFEKRLHQLNRKLNSKDESRLEEDQKTDSRSPKVRKLVRLQSMPMERKVTKSDPYDHKERLAYTSSSVRAVPFDWSLSLPGSISLF